MGTITRGALGQHAVALAVTALGLATLAAAVTRCLFPGNHPCGRFRVYTAPAARDRWRPVPGASGTHGVMGGAPSPVVTVAGGVGLVTATAADFGRTRPPPALLAGPADGSARWRPLVTPCGMWPTVQVAATPGVLLALGCASEASVGEQLKRVYLGGAASPGRIWFTYDDAHTWHLVTLH